MKLFLFIIFFSISSFIFSQNLKNTFIIDGNIHFNYKHYDAYFDGFNNSKNARIYNIVTSPNVGFGINNKIIIGIGIDYSINKLKEDVYYPIFTTNPNTDYILKTIKEESYFPYLFMTYYKNIWSNFYLSGKLSVGYGVLKEETKYDGDNLSGEQIDFFAVKFQPALNYSFFEKYILYVKFASLDYINSTHSNYPPEVNKSTEFNFDYSSSNWLFGFIMKLGKKTAE